MNRLDRMLKEAGVQGDAGVRADAALRADDSWLGSLAAVRAEMMIWIGARDTGDADAEWWGRHLFSAHAARVQDSGPLAIAAAWSQVLARVAPEYGRIAEQLRDSGQIHVAALDPVHPSGPHGEAVHLSALRPGRAVIELGLAPLSDLPEPDATVDVVQHPQRTAVMDLVRPLGQHPPAAFPPPQPRRDDELPHPTTWTRT